MTNPIIINPISYSDEEFRFITYPGVIPDTYKISNHGDIYNSITRLKKSFYLDKDGYKRVGLTTPKHKKRFKNYSIHKLVGHEFVPNENPEYNNIVNHIDTDKSHNYYKNLEHCTDLYNRQHAVLNELMGRGEKNCNNKFNESLIREICNLFQSGYTKQDIRQMYNCYKKINRAIYDLIKHLYNRTSWNYITNQYNY
jgi:hypothetical protein